METGQREYFARCSSGFERVLADELKALRVRRVRPLRGGVAFFGDLRDAYRACLWTRTATRIQLVLARVGSRDAQELYEETSAFPWEEHVLPGATIAVHAHGENPNLRNTQFIALKVKDALCDRLRGVRGSRPDVDPHDPDFALDVSLHDARATLYLNLSGESLHRRGYREDGVQAEAPLKETLAAGILLASGWRELSREGDAAFVDPMCGSGTFAIEAALIAADIAPGLLRNRWGFDGWALHDEDAWQAARADALERARVPLDGGGVAGGSPAGVFPVSGTAGEVVQDAHSDAPVASGAPGTSAVLAAPDAAAPARLRTPLPCIVAGDIDPRAVRLVRENARRAGVEGLIGFHVADAARLAEELGVPEGEGLAPRGLMAVNPPYGHRLLSTGQLPALYSALAEAAASLAPGWELAVVTPDAGLDTALGLTPEQVLPCYNGALEVTLRRYRVSIARRQELELITLSGEPAHVAVAEPNSAQFAARLRKVAKERVKWARREAISCYRVYDADLPDYSLSVDVYEAEALPSDSRRGSRGKAAGQARSQKPAEPVRYLRIAEYQAPASIDPALAARRFADALAIAPAVLDVPASRVFSKVRRREKGGGQYREAQGRPFVVQAHEAGFAFEVDLNGYLDAGVFLDHRTTRGMVGRLARGKRFLNLFAYTGTATVHAAGGGARRTTTVDLSATYLDWAQRNMARNGFAGKAHRFERDDVLPWLWDAARRGDRFDLVFCDPPTFSNSKAMGRRTFDVQRDHVELLLSVADVLDEGGVAVFSCNLRSFKLDAGALADEGLAVRDITAATIPHDFARNPKIHRCFLVARDEDALESVKSRLAL